MPKGNPNDRTIWTERYQKKAGYITKGFKLKKELADRFKEACDTAGMSQASVISKFMEEFIKEHECR